MPLVLYLSDMYLCGMGLWLFALAIAFVVSLKLRRRRRQQSRSTGVVHAALSVWMCLAVLTGVELYFALCVDQSDSFDLTNVSNRWFLRHVHKNSSKFRDVNIRDASGKLWAKEFPLQDRLGRRRLIFTGDSFTFGQGVDASQRFSDLIAEELDKTRRGEFDVHNASGCGFGTPEVLRVLRQLLEEGSEISVVVYSLCLNDIEYQSSYTDTVNDRIKVSKPEFFFFRDTYFFNMLYFRTYQFRIPEIRDYFSFIKGYYEGETWQKMQGLLDDLRTLCEQYQVDLRVAIFPFLHNLGPDYSFRDEHQKLVEYFRAKHIRVLDLEPILAPHAAEGLTANRFDAHPSPRAHQIVADAMRSQLVDDLFVMPK